MSACPECAGTHLRDLVYQHTTSCSLYRADSATTAADHQRKAGHRPATDTEVRLIHEQGYEHPNTDAGEHYGIEFRHDGIHERRVLILGRHGELRRYAGPRPEPVTLP